MGKNVGVLVREASLAAIRDSAGVKGALDPLAQVYYEVPPNAPPLPVVRWAGMPEMVKTPISNRLYEHRVIILWEVVSNPFDSEAPSADGLTEDVIEALETPFALSGYGIPTEEQTVIEVSEDSFEGEQSEDLHVNTITLMVIALADE